MPHLLTGCQTPTRLLHSITRNNLAMKKIMSMIAVCQMIGDPRMSGSLLLSVSRNRVFGIPVINAKGSQFMKLTFPWAVIVAFTAFATVALMSGCSSAAGSVMSFRFGLPVIGAEIDFALSVPAVGVLSSHPTSQPSSANASAQSDSSPSHSGTTTLP